MKEISFILPHYDNDKESLTFLHHELQVYLCKAFGGFTRAEVFGGWIGANGVLFQDESSRYTVAVDLESKPLLADIFRQSIVNYGKRAKQEALYFVVDGKAEIITLAPAEVDKLAADLAPHYGAHGEPERTTWREDARPADPAIAALVERNGWRLLNPNR